MGSIFFMAPLVTCVLIKDLETDVKYCYFYELRFTDIYKFRLMKRLKIVPQRGISHGLCIFVTEYGFGSVLCFSVLCSLSWLFVSLFLC